MFKNNKTFNRDDRLKHLLKEYFGYDDYKPQQLEIINNILDGNDVCGLLPTGFGKSICYQIPYLYLKKNVIIISPLIALMEDQTNQLEKMGIPVCCLNSTNKNKNNDLEDIYEGNAKIIYTTPEYITNNQHIIETLGILNNIGLIAIDESHCVSNWGNDFRADYTKLSFFREIIPNVPLLAVTATATKKIQNDICNILKLKDPIFIRGNFDRPNLSINVCEWNKESFNDKIVPLLEKNKEEKTLIYCKTKKDTDKLAEQINNIGIKCESYHADKTVKLRNEIQKKYTDGDIKCIVATIAFGMGVNIPDIRLVIHNNCPSDLESYYQEIGRGGRDGKPCKCHLFYKEKDFVISRLFINNIQNAEFRRYKENELNHIKKFIFTPNCRREILVKHFDNNFTMSNCGNCDNCLSQKRKEQDFSDDGYLCLDMISRFSGRCGLNNYVNIIRGSNNKKIAGYKNNFINFYGKGNNRSEDWWKSFFKLLIDNGYLIEKRISNTGFGTTINITPLSLQWLNTARQYKLKGKDIDDKDKLKLIVPNNFNILKEEKKEIKLPKNLFDIKNLEEVINQLSNDLNCHQEVSQQIKQINLDNDDDDFFDIPFIRKLKKRAKKTRKQSRKIIKKINKLVL